VDYEGALSNGNNNFVSLTFILDDEGLID